MNRKSILAASLIAGAALSFSAPASATWNSGCKWGKKCPGTSTSSGGTTTTTTSGGTTSSGGTSSGGTTSTSGGATSTSGGTKVPEPGMLGLMGVGLAGLAVARRKKARRG